jgi:pilus assembly protein CpaB
LSYVVQEGMRAITLPVDAISGVAGMIKPRNRVDLLVSLDLAVDASGNPAAQPTPTPAPVTTEGSALPAASAPAQKRFSVVAMQSILVLAVSQNTDANSDTGKDAAAGAGTITLQVTPEQAQKLNLAASMAGSVRLTLRSALDTAEQSLPPMDESVFYK